MFSTAFVKKIIIIKLNKKDNIIIIPYVFYWYVNNIIIFIYLAMKIYKSLFCLVLLLFSAHRLD